MSITTTEVGTGSTSGTGEIVGVSSVSAVAGDKLVFLSAVRDTTRTDRIIDYVRHGSGGPAFTLAKFCDPGDSGGCGVQVWYLDVTSPLTANIVLQQGGYIGFPGYCVLKLSGAATGNPESAYSYVGSGSAPTATVDEFNAGTSSELTRSLITTVGSLVIQSVAQNSSPDATYSELAGYTNALSLASSYRRSIAYKVATGTSTDFGFTQTNQTQFAIAAVSFLPSGGAPPEVVQAYWGALL